MVSVLPNKGCEARNKDILEEKNLDRDFGNLNFPFYLNSAYNPQTPDIGSAQKLFQT